MSSKPFRTAFFAALVSLLSLTGCAVFEPVGGFFAQGYRNTVTYFNAYYNARRLFRSAEEEIRIADRQRLRGTPSSASLPQGPGRTIPAPARQKLTAVIDKCSNILAFHGSSDYVDDALFLVARSYFLLGEYVKSERKCAELLAQYPASELTVPAQVWLGRALLEQSRVEESQEVLMSGLAAASEREDNETQAMALESLSALHRKKGDVGSALRYASQLRTLAPDNESVAAAMLEEARLLLEEERAEQALEPLSSVSRVTDDPFVLFEASMLKADALRRLGRLEDALATVQAMEQDFRFRDRLGALQLERARLLEKTGRLEEAIAAFTAADTSFVRTPTGAEAAFELGSLYETQRGDYASALKQYERSAGLGNFPVSVQARRRASLFARYFQLQSRLRMADSLVTVARQVPPDSTGAPANTAARDSLETLQAATMQDVGEWFYSELEAPDSAAIWLQRSLASHRGHRTTARGLFVMADLARGDSTGARGSSESFLRRIVDEYPETPYASEARKQLSLPDDAETRDRPARLYHAAEEDLQQGAFSSAANKLDSLGRTYPASSLVGKSLYASGWVYENRLGRPESAAVRYRAVVQGFGATEYAESARRRLTEIGTTPADTSARKTRINDEIESPTRQRDQRKIQDDKAKSKENEEKPQVID